MVLAIVTHLALGFAALSGGSLRTPLASSSSSSSSVRHRNAVTMSTRGVVITGGAGGVGYAYADTLMRMGHWVVICDVKDPTAAVEALKRVKRRAKGQ